MAVGGLDVVELAPNRPRQFYRGGTAGAAWRDEALVDELRPEDWLASITPRFGQATEGLTVLPDGRLLRDAVAGEAEAWLGPEHVARFGSDTALLVKLIDAAERLPVHFHPSPDEARRHLGCIHGKNEAWVVVDTVAADPRVWLGFRSEVSPDQLAAWVQAQDRSAILGALHEVPVRPGDSVFVPAGVPHAIGAGVLCLELQEPTDFSLNLEWAGFDLKPGLEGQLGLPGDVVLASVRRSAVNPGELRLGPAELATLPGRPTRLLPEAADPYFRAFSVHVIGSVTLPSSFSVLVVIHGRGLARAAGPNQVRLRRGTCLLTPWGTGPVTLRSDDGAELQVIRCQPPAPDLAGGSS